MTDPKIVDRYSRLARLTLAGGVPNDYGSEQAAQHDPCFGAAAYTEPHAPEAALRGSLGCGNPVAVADITSGETVLDLGSGGGLDVILSARRTGPTGKVYGLDASTDMITLAQENAAQAHIDNTEFLHGTIENIPLPDGHLDVIISNCVLCLSSDKPTALREAFRTLRPGGRLGITDVIADDALTPEQRTQAELAGGCADGTITATQYRDHLLAAGFTTASITPTHPIADALHSAIIKATKPNAPPGYTIRTMRPADADDVLAIYQAGLDTGHASFETTAPNWDAFDNTHLPNHRLVAVDTTTNCPTGWIAASPVSSRCVYAGVIEHSLYIHPDHHRRRLATALLTALIDSTETAGIWTIETGIFPENTASLALHEHHDFRPVGTRERIGQHHGTWRDVTLLERRSPTTGQ
ncbi:GNAT family N-acetyltransferase [Spirillospora sp. CA-294931]|uniref:GNAT family N-acetyltransferase n=1 Tax=Spirillospora sp. CA-294931 TaxID=3240042 RepID=UPI003D91B443